MPFQKMNALTWVVLIIFLGLAIAILIPVLNTARHSERRFASSDQVRGIHQGLVTYAHSNNGYYPGLDASGEDADFVTQRLYTRLFHGEPKLKPGEGLLVKHRYQVLIEGEFFSPEYAISPSETEYQAWNKHSPIKSENYSYAMLQIPPEGARRKEWRSTASKGAIIVTDRNTGTPDKPKSIHGERNNNEQWSGKVLWNDRHTDFNKGYVFATVYDGVKNTDDHLFKSTGTDDALLIHSGN